MVTVEVDWEASAGVDDAPNARVDRPPYIYVGTAEPHWLGQPCQPVADVPANLAVECTVAFACGCRAAVPVSTLVLI